MVSDHQRRHINLLMCHADNAVRSQWDFLGHYVKLCMIVELIELHPESEKKKMKAVAFSNFECELMDRLFFFCLLTSDAFLSVKFYEEV